MCATVELSVAELWLRLLFCFLNTNKRCRQWGPRTEEMEDINGAILLLVDGLSCQADVCFFWVSVCVRACGWVGRKRGKAGEEGEAVVCCLCLLSPRHSTNNLFADGGLPSFAAGLA